MPDSSKQTSNSDQSTASEMPAEQTMNVEPNQTENQLKVNTSNLKTERTCHKDRKKKVRKMKNRRRRMQPAEQGET